MKFNLPKILWVKNIDIKEIKKNDKGKGSMFSVLWNTQSVAFNLLSHI